MKPVLVYSTRICPYCMLAKRLLGGKGVAYQEVLVDGDDVRRDEMMRRSGRRTVPQIFVGDTHVGGYEELAVLERQGKLDSLLDDEREPE